SAMPSEPMVRVLVPLPVAMVTFAPASKISPLTLCAASRVTVYVPAGNSTSTVLPGTPLGDQLLPVFQLPLLPFQVVVGTNLVSSGSNQIRYVDRRGFRALRRDNLKDDSFASTLRHQVINMMQLLHQIAVNLKVESFEPIHSVAARTT